MTQVDQSVIDNIVQQIIALSVPKKSEDGTEYYDPALGALVTAYNALKPEKDGQPNVINAGGGKVGIYDPKTGRIDWSQSPGGAEAGKSETVAVPGRGVVDIQRPDSGVGPVRATTIPGTEPVRDPTSTQENINAKDAAAIAQTTAQTAAIETPQQKQANAIQQINATARAQADAAMALAQAKIDSGIELTEKDKLELQNKLNEIANDAKLQRDQALKQFEHSLGQSDRDRAMANAEAQTENARIANERQAQQADRNQQSDVLKTQAAQGQSFVDQGIKLGVAPTMGLARMALDPLMVALNLSREAIKSGGLPDSVMPQRQAPAPSAPPTTTRSAPAPAATPLPPRATDDPYSQMNVRI